VISIFISEVVSTPSLKEESLFGVTVDSLALDELLLPDGVLSVVVPPHPLSTKATDAHASTKDFFI